MQGSQIPQFAESESEAAQSCLTLSDPMDCSLPGSSVHGISQARVLEWVAQLVKNPVCRVSGKGDMGCDLDGFLTIFIKTCGSVLFIWLSCAFRHKDNWQVTSLPWGP